MSGRILVVDDVATNRIVLKVKLSAACYDVVQAASGQEALERARSDAPDLILLDVKMPDLDGVTVCQRLKGDPATADIPVILVTALPDTISKLRGLRLGADDFLAKPVDEASLLARVRSLLRARDEQLELSSRSARCGTVGLAEGQEGFETRPQIGLIGRTMAEAGAWRRRLETELPANFRILTSKTALRPQSPPTDVFVLAADVAGRDGGLRTLSEIRSRHVTRHAGTILVLPERDAARAAMALDLGAGDVLSEPFETAEMAARLHALIARKRRSDRLRARVDMGLELAMTDGLTNLRNRTYALAQLPLMVARGDGPVAVMMLDLDHFKQVNDRYGHVAGDAVLRAVAGRLSRTLGPEAMLARYGGEEFLAAIPGLDRAGAVRLAETLRNAVAARPFSVAELSGGVPLTVSIGISLSERADDDAIDLIRAADAALYASKAEGRNRMTMSASAA